MASGISLVRSLSSTISRTRLVQSSTSMAGTRPLLLIAGEFSGVRGATFCSGLRPRSGLSGCRLATILVSGSRLGTGGICILIFVGILPRLIGRALAVFRSCLLTGLVAWLSG